MTAQDRPRFAAALAMLAEAYAETVSHARAAAYFLALEDLAIGELEAAVHTCLRTCRFFPRPAELREAIEGSIADQAEHAWARFLTAVRTIGSYQTVDFADAALHETIAVLYGGWEACWRLETAELSYRHAEFLRVYRVHQRRPLPSPTPLPGLIELTNRARGFLAFIPSPIRLPPLALVRATSESSLQLSNDGSMTDKILNHDEKDNR